MTEPAVIVAGAVDAPDLGAAAADAPAAPATKRKERATAIIKAPAGKSNDFVTPFAQIHTRAFGLFLFGNSFLLCFDGLGGPLWANGFWKTFWCIHETAKAVRP
jgi:hypothetical protein